VSGLTRQFGVDERCPCFLGSVRGLFERRHQKVNALSRIDCSGLIYGLHGLGIGVDPLLVL
ncbi:MAG: hypothetical protein MKZ98_04455, partial [Pseudomonadales bacterium]|nr:hypothetical protein [Pseudomonadales bacterium]